jgi:hypothetical protein
LNNIKHFLREDLGYLDQPLNERMILNKFSGRFQGYTTREIGEKLENFVKALRAEGKDLETMELL